MNVRAGFAGRLPAFDYPTSNRSPVAAKTRSRM